MQSADRESIAVIYFVNDLDMLLVLWVIHLCGHPFIGAELCTRLQYSHNLRIHIFQLHISVILQLETAFTLLY